MPPRAQIDVMTDLGRARAHHITMTKRNSEVCEVDPVISCWLFVGSVNSSGYGQVSYPSSHFTLFSLLTKNLK
jgi:hypothetical protein